MKRPAGNTTILHGSDAAAGLRLAIVSEGYSAAELGEFRWDADAATQTILGTAPFDGIPICIARVEVPSRESSAYRSAYDQGADTAFRSYFDQDNPHLLRIDERRMMAAVRAAVPPHWGEYKIVVLVNAPERFGGGGEFLGGAGGQVSGIAVASNANGGETLMHELGHAFGLGDEYAEAPVMGSSPPNVAMSPDELPAFWRARLTPHVRRPTMSTDRDIVGAFQSGVGSARYRPQYSCIMKTSSSLDRYCRVCADWIEATFMATSPERKAA